LIDSIKTQGWNVTVSGFEANKKTLCDEHGVNFYDIPFVRAGMNPFRDLQIIKLYEKIMREEKFDIVHSYTAKPNIYGSIAARKAGIRHIYPTVNGLGYAFTDSGGDLKARLVRSVISSLYKKAFSCATKVFFQNPDDADEMVARGLIERDKCVVISGSGIDLTGYPYSVPRAAPAVFLMATRLLVTKGVRTFFEAARIVKKRFPDAKFLLAGNLDPNPDGISRQELDACTADGSVTYLGHVNDMPAVLRECSAFVLPSYYREGIPHAVLEAMSTGRAIITTDSPGCRETVRDADTDGKGLNGFLIEPKNSEMLAERMFWMIERPEAVRQMGAESRRYAEDRFDVEKVNRIMLETMGIS